MTRRELVVWDGFSLIVIAFLAWLCFLSGGLFPWTLLAFILLSSPFVLLIRDMHRAYNREKRSRRLRNDYRATQSYVESDCPVCGMPRSGIGAWGCSAPHEVHL